MGFAASILTIWKTRPCGKAGRREQPGKNSDSVLQHGELSYLTLEKKTKRDGLCSKKGDSITAQEADQLFHGDTGWMKASGRPWRQNFTVR